MFRRFALFVVALALIGCVGALVYLNPQETSFTLTPDMKVTMPVSLLILAAIVVGAVLMFLAAMVREGRRAVREWRVYREKRAVEYSSALRGEARTLALAGNYAKARGALTKATRHGTPEVGDRVEYAETYLAEGNYREAKRVLEESQSTFGNNPLLLYALARAYRMLGENGPAIAVLERALATFPSSLRVLDALRDALFQTGDWRKGEAVQQQICQLRADDASERDRLLGARYEVASGADPAQRDAIFKGILSIDPDFGPAVVGRARILSEAGQQRRALKLLEKAATRKPRIEILEELERMGDPQEAGAMGKTYARILSAHPDDETVRLRAARAMLRAQETAGAAELLKGAAKGRFAHASHCLWGMLHQERGHWDLAKDAYQQAVAAGCFPGVGYRCSGCGADVGAEWTPRCPRCGTWGALEVA